MTAHSSTKSHSSGNDKSAPTHDAVTEDGARASNSSDAQDGGRADTPAPSTFDPLIKRGVSRQVWEARGYVPYFGSEHPDYDPDTVKRVLGAFDLSSGQKGTYTRFTNSAADELGRRGYGGGLMMLKHPVPGAPSVLPQLRPEHELETGKVIWHDHDRAFRGNPEGLARHLEKEHLGVDQPGLHDHDRRAKYLLPTRKYEPCSHHHSTDPRYRGARGLEKLCGHLRKHHRLTIQPWERERLAWLRDNFPQGEHEHRRPARNQHIADRLDIHPSALERLLTDDGGRVFFALEGCIKADSILAHLIATNTPGSVFNVPSVTLWKAPELTRFANEYLSGRLVVIVADADWHDNTQVVRQALLCREYLRDLDIEAHVAAPPADQDDEGNLKHKGVDDFLSAGGSLEDLVVVDREALFSLALYTSKEGQIRSSTRGLATLLGTRRDAECVRDKLQSYIDLGLLTSDRELSLSENEWTDNRHLEWTGDNPESWPTLTVHEDFRYTERILRLGDFEPDAPVTRRAIFYEELERSRQRPMVFGDDRAAIKATAEREGVSKDRITRESYVAEQRSVLSVIRHVSAQVATTPKDRKRVAQWFGVHPKTVLRERNSTHPILLHFPLYRHRKGLDVTTITPTQERLDSTAQRLERLEARFHGLMDELAGTVVQLKERFPAHEGVSDAVDRFLDDAFGDSS
jgi:hypothetical protein